ncbi:MAG: helicase-related protein [Verrucomicrobiota bacterium]
MLASLIALRKAMLKHPIRHAVSFHSSIHRADLFKTHNDAFTGTFPELGKLETFHVSGKTPTGTRARIIGDFARTKRALITNARCLTEGVDVPGIDCVLFADPRRSAVDIVQAVGRALRPAPGKKLGYVIVPILHDADATPDDIFDSDSFQEILTTLRALAANDDRIIEYFRTVSQGRQHTGGGSVEFDLDERIAKKIDLSQFVQDIELKCWDRLARLSWRPFEEARLFARTIGIKSAAEWWKFCKGNSSRQGVLPRDIPIFPNETYNNNGWVGWGDWLGTGTVSTQSRRYRPFTEARVFARTLGLRNGTEWREYCKGNLPDKGTLPTDIPANPNRVYAHTNWVGMGDWLGTGNIASQSRRYRPFKRARDFVRSLGLKSGTEWKAFCKGKLTAKGTLPTDIPVKAYRTYANKGWIGMGDWLGTGKIANYLRQYRPFKKAREFVRSLGLKSGTEWRAFCKGKLPAKGTLPADIPANPIQTYADQGWAGMGDWLGTGNVAYFLRQYRPFKKARSFARSLGLKGQQDWRRFCKGNLTEKGTLPPDIPANPNQTYADKGWAGLRDWLGSDVGTRHFQPFKMARLFARNLGLGSGAEWKEFCKGNLPEKGNLPVDIPSNPSKIYAESGWAGMRNWLGAIHGVAKYRSFIKARKFARNLVLSSGAEWKEFCRGKLPEKGTLPPDIPQHPHQVYTTNGWISWGDWLATGNISNQLRQYRSFNKARKFARSLGLRNQNEWRTFCKGRIPNKGVLPADIPANPNQTYTDKGWVSMGDWLGTGIVATRSQRYRSFNAARAFVRTLGLKTWADWRAFCKGYLPADIPAVPYATFADTGWISMGDWLGTTQTRTSK